ncbi:ABC transporter ATP-binding protein [Salinisphaera sp. C84B14]|uniref:ABC transporter ATP-binding protein n=1 Tax=Salinisphaera sp. C84B14 TaxID=1304155 RepID=UPI003340E293
MNARRKALLTLDDVGYRYPGSDRLVFEGLDFSIGAGEFVALVGGSGVGKSTVLRCVAGLIEPGVGRIDTPSRTDHGTRPSAVVFQDTRLLPWRSIRANVGYGLSGLGLSRAERDARIDEVLELIGMAELGGRWPHEISGGQAQRVGLARALAVRPHILLMDEPFSAVDALTRTRLQDELLTIWQRLNMAVLFVTHDIAEAAYLAERVCVMRGTPARLVFDEAVPAPYPRERDDQGLNAFAQRVAAAL